MLKFEGAKIEILRDRWKGFLRFAFEYSRSTGRDAPAALKDYQDTLQSGRQLNLADFFHLRRFNVTG